MDPISIGLEALGITLEGIKWVKKIASKELRIIPQEIEATSKHWLSTYIIVQNVSNDPLFGVQIVCWHEPGQEIKIKPKHVQQKQDVGDNAEMDTAFYLISGNVDSRPVKILEFSRIMPNESFEIEVQIHRRGVVRFSPATYNKKAPKIFIKTENKGLSFPFKPPFTLTVESTSISIGIKNSSSG